MFSLHTQQDGEFHITMQSTGGLQTFSTETWSGIGWHFFYFGYEKYGWNPGKTNAADESPFRSYYFRVGRVEDTVSDPTLHVYEDLNNVN